MPIFQNFRRRSGLSCKFYRQTILKGLKTADGKSESKTQERKEVELQFAHSILPEIKQKFTGIVIENYQHSTKIAPRSLQSLKDMEGFLFLIYIYIW